MISQLGEPDPSGLVPAAHGEHHVWVRGETRRVGPYWSDACEEHPVDVTGTTVVRGAAEPGPATGLQPNLEHDLAAQVLRLVCVERILAVADAPDRNTWVHQHFQFDETAFDHVTAALMLVECLDAETCLDEGAPERSPRPVSAAYQIGMLRWYAEHVDPLVVEDELRMTRLPAQARHVFRKLLDRARGRVLAVTDELAAQPEIWRAFVALPREVFEQHAAALAPHAATVAQLRVLAEHVLRERAQTGTVADATVAQLAALRAGYVARCGPACLRAPLGAAITRQLVLAYIARQDAPAALAEARLLRDVAPSAAEDIALRQAATDLGDERYLYRATDAVKLHWEARVPKASAVAEVEGVIAAIDRHGDRATLRFPDDTLTWSEGTNCHETDRIERYQPDGTVTYREKCTGEATHTQRTPVAPLSVPASEAVGLRAGDQITAFARGTPREGRIFAVTRGGRVIRVRDLPW